MFLEITRRTAYEQTGALNEGKGGGEGREEDDEEINKRVQEDMAQATKDLRREDADPNYKEPEAYYPGWFISSCLTNFDADVADFRSLVSLDGIVFADYSGFLKFIFQLDPKDAFAFMKEIWPLLNQSIQRHCLSRAL